MGPRRVAGKVRQLKKPTVEQTHTRGFHGNRSLLPKFAEVCRSLPLYPQIHASAPRGSVVQQFSVFTFPCWKFSIYIFSPISHVFHAVIPLLRLGKCTQRCTGGFKLRNCQSFLEDWKVINILNSISRIFWSTTVWIAPLWARIFYFFLQLREQVVLEFESKTGVEAALA